VFTGVSLAVDLCEGNKIISLKKLFYHSQLGPLKKRKKSGALGTCPVCLLVKTALPQGQKPVAATPPQASRQICMQQNIKRAVMQIIKKTNSFSVEMHQQSFGSPAPQAPLLYLSLDVEKEEVTGTIEERGQ